MQFSIYLLHLNFSNFQLNLKHVENLKKEQREREALKIKEREERMAKDFEKMLDLEIKRKRKETYARWKKGIKRLFSTD